MPNIAQLSRFLMPVASPQRCCRDSREGDHGHVQAPRSGPLGVRSPSTRPEFPSSDFVMGPTVAHRANDSSNRHARRLRENERTIFSAAPLVAPRSREWLRVAPWVASFARSQAIAKDRPYKVLRSLDGRSPEEDTGHALSPGISRGPGMPACSFDDVARRLQIRQIPALSQS